jgi:hypothetical protein
MGRGWFSGSARPDGLDRRERPSGALESALAVSRARARKGSRVSSGAKRRASHGDRRGGASRRCRPDEGKRPPGAACLRRRRSQAADGRTNEQASGASAGSCGRDADCVKARDPVRPREARSLRERATEKKAGGARQSPRSACLPTARSSNEPRRVERPLVLCGRGTVRGKARGPAV